MGTAPTLAPTGRKLNLVKCAKSKLLEKRSQAQMLCRFELLSKFLNGHHSLYWLHLEPVGGQTLVQRPHFLNKTGLDKYGFRGTRIRLEWKLEYYAYTCVQAPVSVSTSFKLSLMTYRISLIKKYILSTWTLKFKLLTSYPCFKLWSIWTVTLRFSTCILSSHK